MALLFNPLQLLVAPFLFLLTVSLAVFAGITTVLALCVLAFRAFVVYFNVFLSMFPHSIFGFPTYLRLSFSDPHQRYKYSPSDLPARQRSLDRIQMKYFNNGGEPSLYGPSLSSTSLALSRRRRRRPSSTSIASGGSITPGGEASHSRNLSNTSLGFVPSSGADRDYEGVGGWRTVDDKDDDQVWTTINAKSTEWTPYHHHRHHSRTASGGAPTTPGDYLMMKSRARSPGQRNDTLAKMTTPNSSRARTPSGPSITFGLPGHGHGDGYFPLTTSKGKKGE